MWKMSLVEVKGNLDKLKGNLDKVKGILDKVEESLDFQLKEMNLRLQRLGRCFSPLSKIEHASAFLYWTEGLIKHFNLLLRRICARARELLKSLFNYLLN